MKSSEIVLVEKFFSTRSLPFLPYFFVKDGFRISSSIASERDFESLTPNLESIEDSFSETSIPAITNGPIIAPRPASSIRAILFTIIGLFSIPIIVIYPLMKRLTHWPQFVLGLGFSWGILITSVELFGVIKLEDNRVSYFKEKSKSQ